MIYHGPVRQVLEHSRELEQIGVQCPRVVSLSNAMKEAGYGDGRICLDLKEAEEMMKRAM